MEKRSKFTFTNRLTTSKLIEGEVRKSSYALLI